MPAVIADTSCTDATIATWPSPRHSSWGLALTPKGRAVRERGDGATLKHAERQASRGSRIPRCACGVSACPGFLGHPCNLLGDWDGAESLAGQGAARPRFAGEPWGRLGFVPLLWGEICLLEGEQCPGGAL